MNDDMSGTLTGYQIELAQHDQHFKDFLQWIVSEAHGDVYTMAEMQWVAVYYNLNWLEGTLNGIEKDRRA